MKSLKLPHFLKLLMLIGCVIAGTTAVKAQQQLEYEVQQGETLYAISKKLNVTISELKQWNNLQSNEIFIGQKLVYYRNTESESDSPEAETQKPLSLINQNSPDENTFYNVKSGDNLYSIARTYNMTVSELKELNNLQSDNIRVGQQLAVRKPSVAPSVSAFEEKSSPQGAFSLYRIQQGENLSSILKKFRMTEAEFSELNPRLNLNSLSTGQEVTVLVPPSKEYPNPYLQKANLQDLGSVAAAVYSESEIGKTTTNGELYNPQALTAAHSSIAMGTVIFMENPANGKGIYVRINDRITGSGIKLSSLAYESLGLNQNESASVNIYMES